MKLEYNISGGDFSKAGMASSEVKKMLKKINVDPKIIKRIVVALYEGEVNVCAHASTQYVLRFCKVFPEKSSGKGLL